MAAAPLPSARRQHPRHRRLDDCVAAFLADCHARALSPRTLEQYQWAIASFRASLDGAPSAQALAALTPDAAREWSAALAAARSPASVRSAVRALKVFSHWLELEEYASRDPLATVRLPNAPEPLIVPLSGTHVAALMDAGNPLLRVAVAILADTGLRSAELCGLAVEDVLQGFLSVVGKGRRERLVPYGVATGAEIDRWVARWRSFPVRRPDERLLLLRSGAPLTTHRLGELMRRAGERLGIGGVRVSPHTLRHTFAIEFLRNGGGELALQKILGHKSLDMVKVYARLTDIDVLDAHVGASPLDRWRHSGTLRTAQRRYGPTRNSSRSSGDNRLW
jgi:integrase/recombinase XerD